MDKGMGFDAYIWSGSDIDLLFKRYPTQPVHMLYCYVISKKSNPILPHTIPHVTTHYWCTFIEPSRYHTPPPLTLLHSWFPFHIQKG